MVSTQFCLILLSIHNFPAVGIFMPIKKWDNVLFYIFLLETQVWLENDILEIKSFRMKIEWNLALSFVT